LDEDFDDFALEAEGIVGADNDRVVVITRGHGTGPGSRALVEMRHGTVYTLEARRIVRVDIFPRPNDALEAAGLRE
jgi:hypothetical protein